MILIVRPKIQIHINPSRSRPKRKNYFKTFIFTRFYEGNILRHHKEAWKEKFKGYFLFNISFWTERSGKGQPFNDQCSHHIATSQLIYRANQLPGFYMMGTLVVKGLTDNKIMSLILSSAKFKYIFSFNYGSQ